VLKSKILASVSIVSLLITGCSSTNESIQKQAASPAPTKVKVDSVAQKTIRDAVDGYLQNDCKPKYVKGYVDQMEVYAGNPIYGFELDQVDEKFYLRSDADDIYGNFATRTLFLNSLYHVNLSYLYSDIFDIYDTEMKSFRKDYSRYERIADTSAKNLCKLVLANLFNQKLSTTDQQKVQDVYDELAANWPGFIGWHSAAREVSIGISEENDAFVKDLMTPKCDEYPTDDGKYVVVKCTVPPG
jgi:hypothetical protein